MAKVILVKGDITKMAVDAIVNAANSSLLGGGGVDGAIHRAAGSELVHECRLLGGCKTGEAKMTKGYNLPAPFIIHSVGPVWNGGTHNEEQLLYNCYANSLALLANKGLGTIAFPNISTGIFHFPRQLAAEVSVRAINDFCTARPGVAKEISIVCFDDESFGIYHALLGLQPGVFSTTFPQ